MKTCTKSSIVTVFIEENVYVGIGISSEIRPEALTFSVPAIFPLIERFTSANYFLKNQFYDFISV